MALDLNLPYPPLAPIEAAAYCLDLDFEEEAVTIAKILLAHENVLSYRRSDRDNIQVTDGSTYRYDMVKGYDIEFVPSAVDSGGITLL